LVKKIIIWGFPYLSCSHSFTHGAFKKAFDYLGYEVSWFPDEPNINYNFNNCNFITEGSCCNFIPINKTSNYFVHVPKNINKFLNNVKNFIDLRYLVTHINDGIYDYTVDFNKLEKMATGVFLEKNSLEYPKAYISWASDLLPEEINFDWVNIQRDQCYYYAGNWNSQQNTLNAAHNNVDSILKFANLLKEKNNIDFSRVCFDKFLNEDEHIKIIQKSYVSPDFRGPKQHEWKYVPCRVFKSISYGHLGAGNSDAPITMDNFLDGYYIHSNNIEELHEKVIEKREDKKFILQQMKLVKERNTFVERAKGLLKIMELL